jgi:pimeloyl-ACP methyl ester carboxylesterase
LNPHTLVHDVPSPALALTVGENERYTIAHLQPKQTMMPDVYQNSSMKPALATSPSQRRFTRKRKIVLLVLLLLVVGWFALGHPVSTHLRSLSILLRLANPQASGFGVRFAQHPVEEQAGTAVTPSGPLKYRLYIPQDVSNPAGMVLLHGVHHLGIEEPRLINFARALAKAGLEVMTPELNDIADYHVIPRSAEQIGISAVILSTQIHQPKVGVIGLSFAGGLALMAATKPEFSSNIGFVTTIGAHDDLARVSRFFATNTIERPDGTSSPFAAHEYGVLVLAYSHLEDFFSPPDIPAAQEALRLWLWEQAEAALKAASRLSPDGQKQFDLLVHHRDQLQQKLLNQIRLHGDEMTAVSPHGHLNSLSVPVLLLHGSGDGVIPTSETEWLAKDVPPQELKSVLISPALGHVNIEDTVTLGQKWDLLHFVAQIIDREDGLRRLHK